MKAKLNISLFIGCFMAVILSGAAFAHTPLNSSQPAANAELAAAPENLVLEFGGQVHLVRLSLVDAANSDVSLNFKPSTQTARQFSIALPELAAGHYTARWAAVGDDGHMLQGNIPFTILASP